MNISSTLMDIIIVEHEDYTMGPYKIPTKAIRAARKAAGLRQSQLAKLVGCAQQTVVDIESGKITRSSFLPKICATLGLDLDKILAGDFPDSVIELKRHDFGSPVPLLTEDQVKGWEGHSGPCETVSMLLCAHPHSPRTFAVRVNGNSLAPTIPQDAIAYIDPDKQISSGSYVLMYLGEYTVPVFRQIFIDGPHFEAVSTHYNRTAIFRRVSSPDELKTDTEITGFIIGKVIYIEKEVF